MSNNTLTCGMPAPGGCRCPGAPSRRTPSATARGAARPSPTAPAPPRRSSSALPEPARTPGCRWAWLPGGTAAGRATPRTAAPRAGAACHVAAVELTEGKVRLAGVGTGRCPHSQESTRPPTVAPCPRFATHLRGRAVGPPRRQRDAAPLAQPGAAADVVRAQQARPLLRGAHRHAQRVQARLRLAGRARRVHHAHRVHHRDAVPAVAQHMGEQEVQAPACGGGAVASSRRAGARAACRPSALALPAVGARRLGAQQQPCSRPALHAAAVGQPGTLPQPCSASTRLCRRPPAGRPASGPAGRRRLSGPSPPQRLQGRGRGREGGGLVSHGLGMGTAAATDGCVQAGREMVDAAGAAAAPSSTEQHPQRPDPKVCSQALSSQRQPPRTAAAHWCTAAGWRGAGTQGPRRCPSRGACFAAGAGHERSAGEAEAARAACGAAGPGQLASRPQRRGVWRRRRPAAKGPTCTPTSAPAPGAAPGRW